MRKPWAVPFPQSSSGNRQSSFRIHSLITRSSRRKTLRARKRRTSMKIAVVGAGDVGGALGKGWAKKGHDVTFGVRTTSDPKLKELLAATGGKARAASVNDAAGGCEVVAFTVPWDAAQDAVKNAGDLHGKIV